MEKKQKLDLQAAQKISLDNLSNFKTGCATIRQALVVEGIYLPKHKKGYTNLHYMKTLLNGEREFIKTAKVKFVDVPLYDELKTENVIKKLNIKNLDNELW